MLTKGIFICDRDFKQIIQLLSMQCRFYLRKNRMPATMKLGNRHILMLYDFTFVIPNGIGKTDELATTKSSGISHNSLKG